MPVKYFNTFQAIEVQKRKVNHYNMINHVIVPDKEFIYTAKQTEQSLDLLQENPSEIETEMISYFLMITNYHSMSKELFSNIL